MAGRRAILAGATGLVGREILEGLLRDRMIAEVYSVGRREPSIEHAKLIVHIIDFAAVLQLPAADEVYLALGTTIKVAGSQQAFRAIDFDANLAVARAAVQAGAKRAGLVSAMGANAQSRVFYSRVKGELEEALGRLGFEGLAIARPSLLIGDRRALGQPERAGERVGFAVGKALGFLVPANYRPIEASRVAKSLLAAVPAARGRRILLSGAMQRE
jgi:uncharacterized protein YbjT (DUF2867 family)